MAEFSVRVRVGSIAFSATGEEKTVLAEYHRFLRTMGLDTDAARASGAEAPPRPISPKATTATNPAAPVTRIDQAVVDAKAKAERDMLMTAAQHIARLTEESASSLSIRDTIRAGMPTIGYAGALRAVMDAIAAQQFNPAQLVTAPGGLVAQNTSRPAHPPLTVPKAITDQSFLVEDDAIRLLWDFPSTTVGLLVILYGFIALKGQTAVPATLLNTAASLSGIDVSRLDRELESVADMVTGTGERRARRYMLTANGIRFAEGALMRAVEGGGNAKAER